MIQPQPVPTEIKLGLAKPEQGDMMVTLEASTITGVQVYFIAPESAVQIGEALQQAGQQATSALFTPPKPSLIVPQ
jgi:hypothetical protein